MVNCILSLLISYAASSCCYFLIHCLYHSSQFLHSTGNSLFIIIVVFSQFDILFVPERFMAC